MRIGERATRRGKTSPILRSSKVRGWTIAKRVGSNSASVVGLAASVMGVLCLPLDPPIPYDKRLIWRTAEQPPAPVRALLDIWHELSGSGS